MTNASSDLDFIKEMKKRNQAFHRQHIQQRIAAPISERKLNWDTPSTTTIEDPGATFFSGVFAGPKGSHSSRNLLVGDPAEPLASVTPAIPEGEAVEHLPFLTPPPASMGDRKDTRGAGTSSSSAAAQARQAADPAIKGRQSVPQFGKALTLRSAIGQRYSEIEAGTYVPPENGRHGSADGKIPEEAEQDTTYVGSVRFDWQGPVRFIPVTLRVILSRAFVKLCYIHLVS